MKQIFCVILSVVLIMLFCACSVFTDPVDTPEETTEVSTVQRSQRIQPYDTDSMDAFFANLMLVNYGELDTSNEEDALKKTCFSFSDDKTFPVPTILSENYCLSKIQCSTTNIIYEYQNIETGLTAVRISVYRDPDTFEKMVLNAKGDFLYDGYAYNERSKLWFVRFGDDQLILLKFSEYCPDNLRKLKKFIRLDLYEVTPDGVVKVDDITHKPTSATS